jgi:hypothetical protein
VDVPYVRPDGVRAATQHPLQRSRWACDSADLQRHLDPPTAAGRLLPNQEIKLERLRPKRPNPVEGPDWVWPGVHPSGSSCLGGGPFSALARRNV